jgi:hypothetical protein
MFVRFPLNRTSSTRRRETGRAGPFPTVRTPGERPWKLGWVSRIGAAVAPVDRPDEAIAREMHGFRAKRVA